MIGYLVSVPILWPGLDVVASPPLVEPYAQPCPILFLPVSSPSLIYSVLVVVVAGLASLLLHGLWLEMASPALVLLVVCPLLSKQAHVLCVALVLSLQMWNLVVLE